MLQTHSKQQLGEEMPLFNTMVVSYEPKKKGEIS
jgi:hypothetical protein